MKTEIRIVYPDRFYPEWDKKIAKITGNPNYDSGMGLGARDIWVEVPTKKLNSIVRKLYSLGVSSVYETD